MSVLAQFTDGKLEEANDCFPPKLDIHVHALKVHTWHKTEQILTLECIILLRDNTLTITILSGASCVMWQ